MSKEIEKTITICGSIKEMRLMEMIRDYYILQGYVVYMPTIVSEAIKKDANMSAVEYTKHMTQLHLKYIRQSSDVYIINTDYYIGEHTLQELVYAIDLGMNIIFYTQDRAMQDRIAQIGG